MYLCLMKKVIFICMGNICRSPAAEGVMQKIVDERGLSKDFFLDSAGTIGYHEGERADARMRKAAKGRGYELTSISRPLKAKDYEEFDLLIVMDDDNYETVISRSPNKELNHKVKYMCEFCTKHNDKIVPDPYFGGEQGFEYVLDLLEDSCEGLLNKIIEDKI